MRNIIILSFILLSFVFCSACGKSQKTQQNTLDLNKRSAEIENNLIKLMDKKISEKIDKKTDELNKILKNEIKKDIKEDLKEEIKIYLDKIKTDEEHGKNFIDENTVNEIISRYLNEYYNKSQVNMLFDSYTYKEYAVIEEQMPPGVTMELGELKSQVIKRKLNTVVCLNSDSIIFNKEKNRITLLKGIYKITAFAPAYYTVAHQAVLKNITADKNELLGTGESAGINGIQTRSRIDSIITVDSQTDFELLHYLNSPQIKSSAGLPVNTGNNEVYSRILIYKIDRTME